MAFVLGSISSTTVAIADNDKNPLTKIWATIHDLQNKINDLTKSHASKSIIPFVTVSIGPDQTFYTGTSGTCNSSKSCGLVFPIGGTITNLIANANDLRVPGSGEHWTFTIIKNGVDTPMTCTISNHDTTCTDTTHSVNVNPVDIITLKEESSSLASQGTPGITVVFNTP